MMMPIFFMVDVFLLILLLVDSTGKKQRTQGGYQGGANDSEF